MSKVVTVQKFVRMHKFTAEKQAEQQGARPMILLGKTVELPYRLLQEFYLESWEVF